MADQVAAFVAGLQDDAGVLACVKHFPGHGGSAADSHVRRAYVHGGAERLDRELLPPFRAAIDAGVASVMLGHVVVTALDPWRPASTSRAAVGLLRRDLGFVGLVVTDALGMAGATAAREVPAAAVRAIAAGADMVCLDLRQEPGAADAVVAAIRAAVRTGRLRESRLREAAGKVADAGRRRDAMAASARGAVPDPVACREVARRVLQVEGDVRLRGGRAPVVVTADARPPAVAADVAWGVGATLRSAAPGTTLRRVGPSSAASFPFGDDPDRELVLVVRDAGVDPWQVALVDRALGLRPGAVLVELGVPAGTGLSAARRVRTPDVSAVSAAAVVDLLLDQG